jgi:hypothetical protein
MHSFKSQEGGKTGGECFYQGDIADAIANFAADTGGLLTVADLAKLPMKPPKSLIKSSKLAITLNWIVPLKVNSLHRKRFRLKCCGAGGSEPGAAPGGESSGGDDVIDAEFSETK